MSLRKAAFGFAPTSITGCSLWMDGADSSTMTQSSTYISAWTSKGTNALSFTQATSSKQPQFVSNVYNGNSVVRCINPGNNVVNVNIASVNNALLQTGASFCIFIVHNPTIANGCPFFFQNGGGNRIGACTTENGNVIFDTPNIRLTYAAPGNYLTTGLKLDVFWSVANAINYRAFGSATASASAAASTWTDGTLTFGSFAPTQADYYYQTDIGEIIWFNTAITLTQVQQVESYLAQKWGLTSSLAAGHPGLTTTVYRPDYIKNSVIVRNVVKPIPYFTTFSPRQISGCALWLDGVDPAGNGVIPANGATVSTWADKSGNGYTAAATGTSTYLTGGGVNFTGSSYFLNQTFSQNLSQRSIFIVFKETTNSQYAGVFAIIPTPNSGNDQSSTNGLSSETTNNTLFFVGNSSGYQSQIGSGNPLPKAIYHDSMNGTVGSGYFNGTNATNVTASYTAGTCSGYGLGGRWQGGSMSGSYRLNGVIYEILFFNSVLGTTQRQQVESYLAQKWGLTASLPGGHSHFTQQAGSITRVANTKFTMTGVPRITFASTGLVITHQDGRSWKVSSTSIGLNTGTPMSITIYAGANVFNSAGGRVALFNGGSSANAVRHSGYNMYTNTFTANNYDFGWKFVSSGSGYLIYNDYPSYSAWQVSYNSGTDRVLIVAPGDGRYGLVWNVTPRVTLAYVYSSY